MRETFMTELQINNVGHLKNIHIDLSASERQPLILTGKNGSGKTSVINALEKFLEYSVSQDFYEEHITAPKVMHYRQIVAETEASYYEAKRLKRDIDYWERLNQFWTAGAVAIFPSYEDLRVKYQAGDFILAFYGDTREIKVEVSSNIEKVDLQDVYSLTDHPSRELVKYLVNLKTTEAFARTNNNSKRAEEIADWFVRFEKVLQSVYEDETLRLEFDIETFKFTIHQENREPFDFNSMSMGYAAVFDIIGDLIMRMEKKRRYNLEGLVLVDEIETHLHVDLQKKIVPILMELFPNIQFVLTTHSPFVLNSTPNAVIYDLENGTYVENGLTNLPYEGVIEGYFKADLLSDELRGKFEEYKTLIQKADLTDQDYARMSELEIYLDEVPDYLALDFAAEYSRLKLEFSNRG